MKRVAQPALSREGKQAFDQYTHAATDGTSLYSDNQQLHE